MIRMPWFFRVLQDLTCLSMQVQKFARIVRHVACKLNHVSWSRGYYAGCSLACNNSLVVGVHNGDGLPLGLEKNGEKPD